MNAYDYSNSIGQTFTEQSNLTFYHTTMFIVHRFNNIFVFAIGLVLSLLLFYLIVRHTPQYLRSFSRLLFICTLADLFVVVSHFLLQTRLRISNGWYISQFTGPFSLLSLDKQKYAVGLQAITGYTGIVLLSTQYYYRYQVIVRRRAPTNIDVFSYFCVPVLLLTFIGISCYIAFTPIIDFHNTYWYREDTVPVLVISRIQSPLFNFHSLSSGLILIGSYLASMYIGHLTVNQLKAAELSKRTRSLHQQLSRSLILQSISPLISVIPITILVVSILAGEENSYFADYAILTVEWTPVLNMLGTLCCIKPYYEYCLGKLYHLRRKDQTVQSISTAVFNVSK
ncbi:hypothetical protein M3Y94_00893200 [Aphelenchoides besseyi]|nr:hypothetical protein M3Y94_00893200 [Aphelenchoides besseyi]KAI6223424.1 hypothetical protein M3Y95_00888700 [Aphelenchoides besseyi]